MTASDTSEPIADAEVEQAHPQLTWNFRELIHAAQNYRQTLAKQMGINLSELIALGHVRTMGRITPNELAQRLDFTTGSVTALVDRLDNAGLVTRIDHESDRRSKWIVATEQGAKAMDDVYIDLDKAIDEATAQLSREDVARFATVMHAMTVRLEEHTAAAVQ